MSGFVYKNGSLDFFAMEAGRVKKTTSGALRYEYNLTDHLGNTRVSFADTLGTGTAVILQEDHYYAFGLRIEGLSSTTKDNKFTYNGKELEDEHGLAWYHYGARFYDAQIGRWHAIDSKDEFYSPYCYVKNNPLIFTDKDGSGIGGNDAGQDLIRAMVGAENLKYVSFDQKTGLASIAEGYNPNLSEGSKVVFMAYTANENFRLDVGDDLVHHLDAEGFSDWHSASSDDNGILSFVDHGIQAMSAPAMFGADKGSQFTSNTGQPALLGYSAHIVLAETGKWIDVKSNIELSRTQVGTHELGEAYAMVKWGVPRYPDAHSWTTEQFPGSAAGPVRYTPEQREE